MPVLVDGGVRSGLDVVRMLALGADFVLLGRAWAYALAARGEAGVAHVLKLIEAEMRVAMALTGCTSIGEIDATSSSAAAIRRRSEARRRPRANSRSTSAARHRLGEQEALDRRAAVGAKLHQLRGFLDALGGGLDVERMGELGDRADDRARAVAGQQVLDEAAVDLELVEREALQIAERRIAGAEIVERDADAERAQRVEQPQASPRRLRGRSIR